MPNRSQTETSPDAPEDAFSRVSAHTAPPAGAEPVATAFDGPLFRHWGDGMREPALRSAFRAAGADGLGGCGRHPFSVASGALARGGRAA